MAAASTVVRYFPGGPRFAFFLLLVAVLVGAWTTVRPVAGALLMAAAVSSLGSKAYRQLVHRLHGHRRSAAALSVAGLLILVLGPLSFLIVAGAARLAAEIVLLPSQFVRVQEALSHLADRSGTFGPALRRLSGDLATSVAGAVPAIANRVGGWAAAAGGAIVSGAIGLFLFTVALYYFLVDGTAWRERAIRLVPIDARHTRALFSRFRDVSMAVLMGNLGTSVLHGVLSGLGYWMFGVSAPLAWGLVTAIASFIPAIGTMLVWGPLCISLFISAGWPRGVGLLCYCAIIVGGADNVARPFLMRGGLQLHPLLVFVAVLGGVESFGAAGIFLGPLLIALTVAALDIYDREPAPAATPEVRTGGPLAPADPNATLYQEVPRDRSRR